jgi:catechol 2,3-dioxygenase-like lactoylglutathione lyase family enzyme
MTAQMTFRGAAMSIRGMNHFTVLARDLAASRAFYVDVLGLAEGPRPPFAFPGAWLYVNDAPVLHIVAGRAVPEPPAGVIDHMAFSASGLRGTVARLKEHEIAYELRRQPGPGTWQLFCHDPSGAKVELDFSSEEPAPEAD